MRQLVSVQRILNLEPIEGADEIEKATVLGWECVVKKGEFNIGDLCVFCEIDSVMPETDAFEFLRKSKFRIKTMKLRGQISQGLCLPMSHLDGLDVSELLGVTKYDPPEVHSFKKRNFKECTFPSFIRRTDETRVQILGFMLHNLLGTRMYATEKLDGTSATYFFNKGDFGVCSRNMLMEPDIHVKIVGGNPWFDIAKKHSLEEKLCDLKANIAIQGEIIGPGIQKNPYELEELEFRVYQVFDIDKQEYLSKASENIFASNLDLQHVPCLFEMDLNDDIKELVQMSRGKSILNENAVREGLVFRPLTEMTFKDRNLAHDRVSFKVINPDFLLKKKD